MPWGRLDDRANGNAKLLALSDSAWRMWGCGLIYCQFNLTNGFILSHAIQTFGVRARNKEAIAEELCSVLVPGKGPCWEKTAGGYQVHDYLDWNESREQIEKDRAVGRERLERFRKRKQNAVCNALQPPLQTPHETHFEQVSTSTTTERSEKPERSRRARVFTGKRLRVTEAQHEVVLAELGPAAAGLEWPVLYGQWDANLVASGEEVDCLVHIKERAHALIRALRIERRATGPGFDPDKEAALAAERLRQEEREARVLERAEAIYQALTDEERETMAADCLSMLRRQFPLGRLGPSDGARAAVKSIRDGLLNHSLEQEVSAVRARLQVGRTA